MKRFIMMRCGYVENCAASCLIYQCEFFGNTGYESIKAAITDLAIDLYNKYYDEVLSVEGKPFEAEEFMESIVALHGTTTDLYGDAEVVLLAALLEAKPELDSGNESEDYSSSQWEQFKNNIQPKYY